MTLENLASQWLEAKAAEAAAVEARRILEDKMSEALAIEVQGEGTTTAKEGGYTIKVTNRLTRKVDSELIQELAAEHGLNLYLSQLFRWKPEIEMKAWKGANPEVTAILSKAITATAGRPSFAITVTTGETK